MKIVFLLFVTFLYIQAAQQPNDIYDVIVYSATPAGISAACAAADMGLKNIALIEPTNMIGGMMSPGGIGFRDFHNTKLFGTDNRSSALQWIDLNTKHYNASSPVYQPDHYVGQANLWSLLNARPSINVILNTTLTQFTGANMNGTKIESIQTFNTINGKTETYSGRAFVDATYEGDLMIASGAKYIFGRESKEQYNESYAGVTGISDAQFKKKINALYSNGSLLKWVDPEDSLGPVGSADHRVMGYSYRLCITTDENNKAPFPTPDEFNYNPEDWELLRRTYNDQSNGDASMPFGALEYRGYPVSGYKKDMCDSGTVAPITTDAANLNQGYSNGTYEERKKIIQEHKDYLAGMIHFLKTDPDVPSSLQNSMNKYGLCKDEWPENNHWPPLLYVREASRLVGDQVYNQNTRVPATSELPDSIALADWSIDIHIMARTAYYDSTTNTTYAKNEGQTPFNGGYAGFTFELPYYVLTPRKQDVTNLLVPNCASISHVVFSAIREEPCLWQLGRASGIAAGYSALNSTSVQDLDIKQIQKELLAQGAHLHQN